MGEATPPPAVVGEWNGRGGAIARLIVAAQMPVVFFDLMNPESIDCDHPSEAPEGDFPGLTVVGDNLREFFANHEDACTWAVDELRQRFGAIGVVVIADWIATICNSNGRRMLAALNDEDQGRLIAVEGPSTSADQVVRWMTRWREDLPAPGTQLQILRAPSDEHGDLSGAEEPRSLESVLLNAGYSAVTIDDVERQATEDRASGADELAGRLWEEAGITDVGHGIAAFAATRLTRSWPPPGKESPAGIWDLRAAGQPAVLAKFSNAFCGIETSPPAETPDAIRIVLDTDTFDLGGTWEHVAEIDLSGGSVFVGGWEMFDTADPWEVKPGRYAVDRWDGESQALRIQHLDE